MYTRIVSIYLKIIIIEMNEIKKFAKGRLWSWSLGIEKDKEEEEEVEKKEENVRVTNSQ